MRYKEYHTVARKRNDVLNVRLVVARIPSDTNSRICLPSRDALRQFGGKYVKQNVGDLLPLSFLATNVSLLG